MLATNKQWLSNMVQLLLLALCVLMAVYWVRGFYVKDALWWQVKAGGPLVGVTCVKGSVSLVLHETRGNKPGFFVRQDDPIGPVESMIHRVWTEPRWVFCGFGCAHSYAFRTWVLSVPNWLVICVAGVWPCHRFLKSFWAARRAKTGCCPACGYDLRASLQRCPECGRLCDAAPEKSEG